MKKWLLPVVSTALVAVLLYTLAWQLTRQGIDRQAHAKVALLKAGHTPWDFSPRTAADLIAGRAFGDARVSHDRRGLVVRSINGKPYELGVPLPYPLDLKRFPVARLVLDVEAPTRLRWVLRRRLGLPLLTSASIDLHPGTHDIRVDLHELEWSRQGSRKAASLPPVAAMLRLKLQHAPDSIIRLQGIDWLHAEQASRPSASDAERQAITVFSLGVAGVEDMLGLRDIMRNSSPATVVASSTDALRSPPPVAHGAVQSVLALLAYALFLFWTWQQTRRVERKEAVGRILPIMQMAICAGPTLSFTIGMYGKPDAGAAWLAAMLSGLGFAIWLAWRGYGEHWRWLHWQGRMAWRDWTMPAVTTAAAIALLLACSAEPQLPDARKLLAYAIWAAVQQVLILAVLAPRVRHYVKARWLCALALAVLFSLAHAPNAMLMELTLLAELLWAWQFLKRPVLLPIILAHATAGLLLAMGIGELPLRSLEVGARFLQ